MLRYHGAKPVPCTPLMQMASVRSCCESSNPSEPGPVRGSLTNFMEVGLPHHQRAGVQQRLNRGVGPSGRSPEGQISSGQEVAGALVRRWRGKQAGRCMLQM